MAYLYFLKREVLSSFPLHTLASPCFPSPVWAFSIWFSICPSPSLLCLSWPFAPWLSRHCRERPARCAPAVCCGSCPTAQLAACTLEFIPRFYTHSFFPFSFFPGPSWWAWSLGSVGRRKKEDLSHLCCEGPLVTSPHFLYSCWHRLSPNSVFPSWL